VNTPDPFAGAGRATINSESGDNFPDTGGTLLVPKHPSSTIPEEYTHPASDPCPFQKGNFPSCPSDHCCCLRIDDAFGELSYSGADPLCQRLLTNKTAKQALEFADRLNTFIDVYRRGYRAIMYRSNVVSKSRNGTIRKKRWVYSRDFTRVVASLQEVVRWYRKVGRMGCGVHVDDGVEF
jgi:hypothetical protein